MQTRTKDRLLKYQYFLAKAFQYRTLRPYSGRLDLTDLFDEFIALVEQSKTGDKDQPDVLTPDEFSHLEGLYEEELGRIIAEIAQEALRPSQSVPVSFKLTGDELARLNEEGRVVVNLRERGIFGKNQENIRMADLRTKDIVVSADAAVDSLAVLRLTYEHSGISRLTSGGETFRFQHYRTDQQNPITWNTVFDGLTAEVNNSELSPATRSLVRTLINREGVDVDNLLFFSRPAGFADIVITREVTTNNGVALRVDDLRIEVQYDFESKSSLRSILDVKVTEDLTPTIVVHTPDLTGRQHGRGDFRRVFSRFDEVVVRAQARFGEWEFDHWVVDGAPVVEERAAKGLGRDAGSLEVSMAAERDIEAVYVNRVSPPPPPPGVTFRRGDADGNGKAELNDAISTLVYLFIGGIELSCLDAADSNDSGELDTSDAIKVLSCLFLGSEEPPGPGAHTCGLDPTEDEIDCEAYDACP